jgi:hypothetical protein
MSRQTPSYCRARADECERLAAKALSSDTREMMTYLAMRWRAAGGPGRDATAAAPTEAPNAVSERPVKTAAELRDEAQRIRVFALSVFDPEVMTELQFMIEELERRARVLENGNAH